MDDHCYYLLVTESSFASKFLHVPIENKPVKWSGSGIAYFRRRSPQPEIINAPSWLQRTTACKGESMQLIQAAHIAIYYYFYPEQGITWPKDQIRTSAIHFSPNLLIPVTQFYFIGLLLLTMMRVLNICKKQIMWSLQGEKTIIASIHGEGSTQDVKTPIFALDIQYPTTLARLFLTTLLILFLINLLLIYLIILMLLFHMVI